MQYKLLAQLPENNPNDHTEVSTVDAESAVELISNYDWKKEYQKIKHRESRNITSSVPKLIIQNVEATESLSIRKDTDDNFIVEYSLGDQNWSEYFSCDFNQNNSGLDEINFIVAFFDHKLERYFTDQVTEQDYSVMELDENSDIPAIIAKEDLLMGKYILPRLLIRNMWFVLAPILFLSIMAFSSISILATLAFVGALYTILLTTFFTYLLTLLQYIRFPRIKNAVVSKDGSFLDINYADRTSRIYRTDILQCVYTYNSDFQKASSIFQNIVITLNDKRQFYLTTLTFTHEELSIILNRLNINIYKFDSHFPFVRTKVISNDFGVNLRDYTSIPELEEKYANYTDEKLKEILFNEDEYQPEAVGVVKRELQKREH